MVPVDRRVELSEGQTRLQVWTCALIGLLDDAREELDEREWPVFVHAACDRVGVLGAELVLRDLLRGERGDERDAA
jgi:hypothetical protein